MKWLWFAGGAAVVITGGVAFFAHGLITKFDQENRRLQEAYEARAVALRALDNVLPRARHPTLHPGRFPVWLGVRTALAKAYEARIAQPSEGYFHARETTNLMLEKLREELEGARMGLTEYLSLAERWRALLARDELAGLRDAWRRTVFTKDHPEGLPLPEPAADAGPEEIELVRTHAKALEASLHADLLGPLLEEVRAGGAADK